MNVANNLVIDILEFAFDSTPGWESIRLSFIANRPKEEPGFNLEREDVKGRSVRYKISSYSAQKAEGSRY